MHPCCTLETAPTDSSHEVWNWRKSNRSWVASVLLSFSSEGHNKIFSRTFLILGVTLCDKDSHPRTCNRWKLSKVWKYYSQRFKPVTTGITTEEQIQNERRKYHHKGCAYRKQASFNLEAVLQLCGFFKLQQNSRKQHLLNKSPSILQLLTMKSKLNCCLNKTAFRLFQISNASKPYFLLTEPICLLICHKEETR